ncbi:hypothetical protein Tco_0454774 [Tanacetum coccineum]
MLINSPYEVEVANIPCNSKKNDDSEDDDDDLGGDDEVELTDGESSDDMNEVAEVFYIDTNLFDFETPMYKAFNRLNYPLCKSNGYRWVGGWGDHTYTKDIKGFKTYEDNKNDWIYEWNKDVPWVDEKPWTNTRVWTKPTPVKHTGISSERTLEDSELKDLALRNKAIIEGFINEDDDESRPFSYRASYSRQPLRSNSEVIGESKQRAHIYSLNEEILKINYSEDKYVVSTRDDNGVPLACTPQKTIIGIKINSDHIQRNQYAVFKIWNQYNILERYQAWSLLRRNSPNTLRMTKVIKEEFEKIMDVKVEDVSLTCDTQLEIFNMEVNRLSRMDDDLFTYEVEVANILCNSKKNNDSKDDDDDDMGYDLSDAAFIKWLRAYIIGNQLHYQDYEWYEALEDYKLKDEALRNKAIMEGSIKEDNDERYMMIKYSFNNDEEYVAVKEDEYDDLTVTRKDACRA